MPTEARESSPPAAANPTGSIGLSTAVALYLGAVLGAGVLVLPGAAATIAGPASLFAWALVCGLSVPVALTFAALAAATPDAGGIAGYGTRAFGPTTGATVGWFYFVAVAVGQAVVTLTGAYYVADLAGLGRDGTFLVSAGFLACATVTNLAGLRLGGRVGLVLAGTVALLLAFAIIAALPRVSLDAFSPFAPEGAAAVGEAAVPLLFAFFGWEAITHLSAEFRDPGRDILRATRAALVIVSVLYLGLAFAVVGTAAQQDKAGRTAVAELLGSALGSGTATGAASIAALVTLATANTFVAAGSRLGYALARDRAFPVLFERRDRRGTPVAAVGLVAGLAGLTLLVAYWRKLGAEDVVLVPSTLGLATYMVGTAAALKLLPAERRSTAWVALVVCVAIAPFAAGSLLAPLAVAAAAIAYLRWRGPKRYI